MSRPLEKGRAKGAGWILEAEWKEKRVNLLYE